MTKRLSTAAASDLASRRRRQQSAATILLRTFDDLIDVPMHYWIEAGEGWRRRVLEARVELHRIMGQEADDARRAETEEQRRQSEQRRSEARQPRDHLLEQIGLAHPENSGPAQR